MNVLTALALFDPYIPNDGIYKGGVYMASLFGLFDALVIISGSPALTSFVHSFPLGDLGFAWVIPSLIGMIIGYFIYRGKARVAKMS